MINKEFNVKNILLMIVYYKINQLCGFCKHVNLQNCSVDLM